MLEVLHHQDGSSENPTPAASISRIIDASEFSILGDAGLGLRREDFVEAGIYCDLVQAGPVSNLYFGVQALFRVQMYHGYDYAAMGIQGSWRPATLVEEIDREDMPPWQAVMDGRPIDPTAISLEKWQTLEGFHAFAWDKVVEALIEADSGLTFGKPKIGRSPLWNYYKRT